MKKHIKTKKHELRFIVTLSQLFSVRKYGTCNNMDYVTDEFRRKERNYELEYMLTMYFFEYWCLCYAYFCGNIEIVRNIDIKV